MAKLIVNRSSSRKVRPSAPGLLVLWSDLRLRTSGRLVELIGRPALLQGFQVCADREVPLHIRGSGNLPPSLPWASPIAFPMALQPA
jgi:hypothetical protein